MKNQTKNYLNKRNLLFIIFMVLAASFAFNSETDAQYRHGIGRGFRGFGGRGGIGVVRVPRSYVRVAPRIGARIRVLPAGYLSFWWGGFPYYYYDGIYYQYLTGDRVYTVVNKPEGLKDISDLKFDQVKMADGSVVEGVFKGATESTITMSIGGKNQEINIGDIVSINFAPPAKDSTKVK